MEIKDEVTKIVGFTSKIMTTESGSDLDFYDFQRAYMENIEYARNLLEIKIDAFIKEHGINRDEYMTGYSIINSENESALHVVLTYNEPIVLEKIVKYEKENSGEYPESISDGNLSKGSFLSMVDILENENDTFDGIADGIIYIAGIRANKLINSLIRMYEKKYDKRLSF